MKKSEKEKAEALDQLRKWIKPGDKVYTVLRHVSRSGMQREIGVVVFVDGQPLHPNYSVAKALGWRQGKQDGVIVGGCGMDMGAHLVQTLSYIMFPDGFDCLGKDCPSNDHSNAYYTTTKEGRCLVCEKPNPKGGARSFTRESGRGGHAYPVCSQECATKTWRHRVLGGANIIKRRSGGYALRQVWL